MIPPSERKDRQTAEELRGTSYFEAYGWAKIARLTPPLTEVVQSLQSYLPRWYAYEQTYAEIMQYPPNEFGDGEELTLAFVFASKVTQSVSPEQLLRVPQEELARPIKPTEYDWGIGEVRRYDFTIRRLGTSINTDTENNLDWVLTQPDIQDEEKLASLSLLSEGPAIQTLYITYLPVFEKFEGEYEIPRFREDPTHIAFQIHFIDTKARLRNRIRELEEIATEPWLREDAAKLEQHGLALSAYRQALEREMQQSPLLYADASVPRREVHTVSVGVPIELSDT